MQLKSTQAQSVSVPVSEARPERRQAARTTLEGLAYISIEPDNGGILLNVSEGGLGFHSIAPVQKGKPVHFSFTERNRHIQAEGEIVWIDDSGTAGGLRFKTVPPELRQQIRAWANGPSALTDTLIEKPATTYLQSRIAAGGLQNRPRTQKLRVRLRLSGFARGLATGFLLSGVLMTALLVHTYRRHIGESLIHFGERLAASPGTQMTSSPALAEGRTAARELAHPIPSKLTSASVSASSKLPISVPARSSAPLRQTKPEGDLVTVLRKPLESVSPKTPPATAPVVTPKPEVAPRPVVAPTIPSAMSSPKSTLVSAPDSVADKTTPPPLTSPSAPLLKAESTAVVGAPAPELFFEVGRFKKQFLAEQTQAKLTKMGLPASIVQKGHLWMNSYRLLVGPYGDETGASTASRTLLSVGFTPRPFERGSRTLVLASKLTVDNTPISIGECEVQWESYIPTALVKFVQRDDAVVTASGVWEKRSTKFEHNAIVYQRYPDGRRVLIEIQFAGMDRALVFGKSS